MARPDPTPADIKSWLRDTVAPEIQEILEDRPENFPRFAPTEEYGAFLVWLARNFIPGRFDDLFFADGSGDGGIDICQITNAENVVVFSIFQVSGPRFDQGRVPILVENRSDASSGRGSFE